MKSVFIKTNAAALLSAVLDREMTACDAARACGIHRDTFFELIRRDKKITLRTAAKLRKVFGDRVIQICDDDWLSAIELPIAE